MSVRACGGCMGAIRLAPSSCSHPIRLWHWYCKGDLKTARSFQQANPRTDATDMDFPPPSCLGTKTAWKLSVSLKPIDQPAELLSPPLLFHKQVHDFFIGYEKKKHPNISQFCEGEFGRVDFCVCLLHQVVDMFIIVWMSCIGCSRRCTVVLTWLSPLALLSDAHCLGTSPSMFFNVI